jgi:hypothetical protein
VLSDDSSHKNFEVLVKFGSQRGSVAELREFAVNSSNNLNIIVFDELQILFLVLLRVNIEI